MLPHVKVSRKRMVEGVKMLPHLKMRRKQVVDGGPQCCPMPRYAGKEL